jgi:hypothetical protein
MTEEEAATVAKLAADMGRDWNAGRLYGPVMRYGRLFTPGTEIPPVADQRNSGYPGKNAYRLAMESGLRYAEGYARLHSGITTYSAWCLDDETVVHPGLSEPGTAYFGVVPRPDYLRQVYESHPDNDHPQGGFSYVLGGTPVDPATDLILDLGRDIPSWVREWALSGQPHSGDAEEAPAWVKDELLRFGDRRPMNPDPYLQLFVEPVSERSASPLPMSYARYLVRRDFPDGPIWLSCSGRTGGVSSDNGTLLQRVEDGDSLDTLIRWADEHRLQCEWAWAPGDEREHPELTAQKRAEVHLRWTRGFLAERSLAVLHRLDYNVWDAWRHPTRVEGSRVVEEPPVLLTRNGVSYEMALAAAFRAMGNEMPDEFAVVYLY